MLPGASLEALGAAWGRQRGLSRGAWRLHLRLDGLWGVSGGHFGPPWVAAATSDGPLGVVLVPFRTHFGVFSVFRFVFALNEARTTEET
mgnify:CR=1 FL=1